MIAHCYREFVSIRNYLDGVTPFNVLASKPKAFKSGSSLSWWKRILYYCKLTNRSHIRIIINKE
ncbi:hypothetical protein Fmac_026997 [Flemingia macrophylla]|uniref:Uncharacterized protein n=1 Tax=Flemingia macrophylla TaxID=520843 RepID=A0ABD1LGF2_9FABA